MILTDRRSNQYATSAFERRGLVDQLHEHESHGGHMIMVPDAKTLKKAFSKMNKPSGVRDHLYPAIVQELARKEMEPVDIADALYKIFCRYVTKAGLGSGQKKREIRFLREAVFHLTSSIETRAQIQDRLAKYLQRLERRSISPSSFS